MDRGSILASFWIIFNGHSRRTNTHHTARSKTLKTKKKNRKKNTKIYMKNENEKKQLSRSVIFVSICNCFGWMWQWVPHFKSQCEENEKRRENLEMCGEHRPPSMRFALEVFWFLGRMFYFFNFIFSWVGISDFDGLWQWVCTTHCVGMLHVHIERWSSGA